MDTIDAAGRELVQLDAEALATRRLRTAASAEEKIHHYAHELLDFDNSRCWLSTSRRGLETVIASGFSEVNPCP